MKYLVIVIDGAAGEKVLELGNKTSLEKANMPVLNSLSKKGEVGLVKTIPDTLSPGSDVANMSILSYDPTKYLKGRSSLEAISIGLDINDDDTTFRVNLVTFEGNKFEDLVIKDHSANNISTKESINIISQLNKELKTNTFEFFSGVSYRNLLVFRGGLKIDEKITPPHDILDQKIVNYLPKNETILNLMKNSFEILKSNTKNKANGIWIWGEGKKTNLPKLKDKYNINGSAISAVDLIKGIAIAAGLDSIDVEGATGDINTNFKGKRDAVINEFKKGKDFVFLHLEAPDEAGHKGDYNEKVKSLEIIDELVTLPLVNYLNTLNEDFKILVLPDHKTPIKIRTHSSDPVPYLIFDSTKVVENNNEFTEECANAGKIFDSGDKLFDYFIKS